MNNFNFVYVCKDGPNEELRYSLRSLDYSFPNSSVWIVGGRPAWYVGNYIEVNQMNTKYKNVFENLKTVCESNKIPESFVLMNDDFFIIEKIENIINYNSGYLLNKINLYQKLNSKSGYTRKLFATHRKLESLGIKESLDYEMHMPMIMEKEKLNKILKYKDQFLWRSMYGNIFKVESKQSEDVKVYTKGRLILKSYNINKKNSPYLSSSDSSFDIILNDILSKQFQTKTKYEK